MKKLFIPVLCAALVFSLAGCVQTPEDGMFYYTRYDDAYQYGQENAVIAGEYREITSHNQDLTYLLTLYFHGPTQENLCSPFPSGITLRSVERTRDTLMVELSASLTMLSGTDLTLACACLAKTCFSLTDAQAVTISSDGLGFVSITLTRDSLVLFDDTPIPTNE